VYAGALDGYLYVLDAATGNELAREKVYQYAYTSKSGTTLTGSVTVPVVMDGGMYLGFSDGRGMNTVYGGLAIYDFDRASGAHTRTFYTEGTGI